MQIPAGEFKAKCLEIMERVARTGKAITITKRGKPIAKLVPLDPSTPRAPLFGRMAGSVAYEGDLLAPVEVDWQVLTAQVGIAPSEGARQKANRVAMPRRKKR